MAAVDLIPIVAPELVANANLAGAITIAEGQIAAGHCQRELAVAYLAAHILTMSKRAGSAGTVTSKTEGSLSIGYGAQSVMGALGATSYGQELSRINRLCYGMAARTGWIKDSAANGL